MIDGRAAVLNSLADEVCREEGVVFAVVFGSSVSGEARPSSDVDVGIKFEADLTERERFRRRYVLSATLQRTEWPFVDVSDIEELPLPVAHRVVCGDLLCGDKAAFRRFKQNTEAAYEESRGELSERSRTVIDRIAEEGLRG